MTAGDFRYVALTVLAGAVPTGTARAKSTLAAALAIGIGALAGCGGGGSSTVDQAKFKDGLEPAGAQLQQTAVAIAGAIKGASSQTDPQVQATFSGLADRWQSSLDRVHALSPPSAEQAEVDALATAGARVESDLNQLAAAAGTHSAAAARQSASGLLTDLVAVKSAALALEQKLGDSTPKGQS